MTISESKGRFFLQNESIRIDSHNGSNRIEKIDSIAKIESNRNFFCPNWNALLPTADGKR